MEGQFPDGLVCAACGHRNRAGRKFCAECGTQLVLACPSCGTPNEPGERFCGECGLELAATRGGARPETAAPGVERRLVSVLFADLVGHTSRSESRDVEEVRELLARYFDVARTVVERYGGEVEKFIGDAVMAVWGTPTAREDDAERSVRAALELVAAVADLNGGGQALAARAGVLTGEAAVSLGARGQGMVAGDLVNTASRVQALAEPGTVLVGEATRRAAEASIAFEDVGEHELKGKGEPLRLWRALHVTAGRGGGLKPDVHEPPFVGRERELRLLKGLFHASADESKAHLVSVVGVAGIGKSRLAWELQKYLDGLARTVLWHRGRCLAYGEGVSYWALGEMMRMRAGIAEGEAAASARAKLQDMLERYVPDGDEREWISPRLAQLLGLEEREAGERPDLFAGWRLFLERLAEHEPVVLVFEDMQWADAALLEFLAHLLDWSRAHPLFVLALARPELGERHPRWASEIRNVTTLSLEPLAHEAMEELLDGFVPGLPGDVRRQVLERAEGVPLYAVETVRMLLDRGLLEQHGSQYRPTGPIEALEVPETLHALVASRLDSLEQVERRLLQDASVLGKTFTRTALASLGGSADQDLDRMLASLVRKEILVLQADPRSPERGQYGFLQDLLRQVAYETMARSERKARHLAVASDIEREWQDGEHEIAEILASHYLAALELEPNADDAQTIAAAARATLLKAGERAASLAANRSAQHYYEQALALAESPLEQAELHERAGHVARLAGSIGTARAHLEQAIAAFDGIGLPHRAARVTAELGLLTWLEEDDVERAIEELQRAFDSLAAGERGADLANLAAQLSRPLFFAGRVDEAMERNELALELAEAFDLPEVLSHGLNTKAMILGGRGRRVEGTLLMRHALALALEHDLSEAALRAYNNLAAIEAGGDRYRRALEVVRAAGELAHRVGDRGQEGNFTTWTCGLLGALGEWDEALGFDTDAPAEGDELEVGARFRRFMLAGLFLERGQIDEAQRRLEEIRGVVDSSDSRHRSGLYQIEAAIQLAGGNASAALETARKALADRTLLGIGHDSVKEALRTALEAAFELEDESVVDELLELLEGVPPGELSPALRALAARFGGRRAALRGDAETADAGFRAATELLDAIEIPFHAAVVRLEHAEWLASAGRHEDAASPLADARATFERLRATPWIERVDTVQQPAALER